MKGKCLEENGIRMLCVYCKKVKPNNNRSHALPEAIWRNSFVLPNGVICDLCNKKFSPLDQSIITHPEIARRIQSMQLPGKRGKRKILGYVKSKDSVEFRHLDINMVECKSNSPTVENWNQIIGINITLKTPRDFNNFKFSRAIHYLALNLLAYKRYDLAMLDKYDGFRNYVYNKKSNKMRAYYEGYSDNDELTSEVNFVSQVFYDEREFFLVSILGIIFLLPYD